MKEKEIRKKNINKIDIDYSIAELKIASSLPLLNFNNDKLLDLTSYKNKYLIDVRKKLFLMHKIKD